MEALEGTVIIGKDVARPIYERLREQINSQREKDPSFKPKLAFVMVGVNKSGEKHRELLMKAIKENELEVELLPPVKIDQSASEAELIRKLQTLNEDENVNAILIVQPLPENISIRKALEAVAPSKEVEGVRYANCEMLENGQGDCTIPPSPAACLALIQATGVTLRGKHVAVITKQSSELAMVQGNPTVQLMRREGCFVTYIDPDIENAHIVCSQADIVIVMDHPGETTQINKDWIKQDAVVIDAGLGLYVDGKSTGFVNTTDVQQVARWVTPVPGGVGPVHVAHVLVNTVDCARKQRAAKTLAVA